MMDYFVVIFQHYYIMKILLIYINHVLNIVLLIIVLNARKPNYYTCLECTSNYILIYNISPISCIEKSLINDSIYTIDNKIYYPCNNLLYNEVEHCEICDKKEECKSCSSEFTLVNGNKICILTSDIEAQRYYKDYNNNYYYKCKEPCSKCESERKCIVCNDPYLLEENYSCINPSLVSQNLYYYNEIILKYSKCSNIPGCFKCTSGTECISCIVGYYLAQDDDNKISCQIIDINKYYEYTEGDKRYYKKCSKSIENCDECSEENKCTKCLTNYGIVDNDYVKCENLLTEKYYYDTTLETFKFCSIKMPNCELCTTYGDFICKKCFSNYAFKHNNNIECVEKIILEKETKLFTNDTGNNYYSCFLYGNIKNCDKCSNIDTCDECKLGFNLFNNGALCAQQEEIDNNIYIWSNDGTLVTCSSLIPDCNRCNDSSTCYECKENAALIDNNTCLNKTEIEINKQYYKDNSTNRYISCSMIDNCITCNSSTVCTLCHNGFTLNENNQCNKIYTNNNNSNEGLSTGAKIGIVFGCLGFVLLMAGIVYFIWNKFYKKKNDEVAVVHFDEKFDDKKEEVVFSSSKS